MSKRASLIVAAEHRALVGRSATLSLEQYREVAFNRKLQEWARRGAAQRGVRRSAKTYPGGNVPGSRRRALEQSLWGAIKAGFLKVTRGVFA